MLCPSIRSLAGRATDVTAIGPLPAGQPFAPGGGVGVVVVVVVVGALSATTAVGVDVRAVDPSALVAVTRTRSVLPSSGFLSVYVFSLAPPIAAQLPPSLSQRCHW